MKKTIIINAFGKENWIGGLYYRKNIAFQLAQNDYIKNNYNILIYCYKGNKHIYDDLKGIVKIKSSSITNKYIQKILKLFIIIFNRGAIEFPITRREKYLGITSISWIPDFQHRKYPDFFSKEELERRDSEFLFCGKSNMPLVLSSKDCLNDFKKYYNDSKNNVYVVPFVSCIDKMVRGLSFEFEKKILDKFSLDATKYAVVMNQFWQHKNHKVVIEAMKYLFDNHSDCDLKIVLTGRMEDYRNSEYIESLKTTLNTPSVASHIKLLGFIDREEQIVVMKNASFVIQPSLFEGWGTVVEDAKVLDKTILLSDIPIHHEQMNDKSILFDPDDPQSLAELMFEESKKDHFDDITKGVDDMYRRAKEYSKGFETLLKELEIKK